MKRRKGLSIIIGPFWWAGKADKRESRCGERKAKMEKVGRGREEESWTYSYDIQHMLLPRDNDDPLKISYQYLLLDKMSETSENRWEEGITHF